MKILHTGVRALFCRSVTASAAALLMATSNAGAPAPSKDVVVDTSLAPVTAAAKVGTWPQQRSQFAQALSDLGLAQLRQLPNQGNAVVSPLSLANALGLVQLGAKGRSADEIAALFEPTSSGTALLGQRLPELLPDLQKAQVGVSFTNANRLWVGTEVAKTIEPSYAQAAQHQWHSSAQLQDFAQPQTAADHINAWVGQATHGQISQLLQAAQLRPNTQLVLTNAVYFKGQWAKPFAAANTVNAPFKLPDGSSMTVPTMRTTLRAKVAEQAGAMLLELPYGTGDYVMQIALPAPGESLGQLQANMSAARWAQWSAGLQTTELDLSLPRFKVAGDAAPLKPLLQKLGVQTVFGPGADFSGLTSAKSLALDDIYQSARIQVDEEGAEASAATAAVVVAKSLSLPTRLEVNQPFLFNITHKPTQTTLFVGRVTNPAQ